MEGFAVGKKVIYLQDNGTWQPGEVTEIKKLSPDTSPVWIYIKLFEASGQSVDEEKKKSGIITVLSPGRVRLAEAVDTLKPPGGLILNPLDNFKHWKDLSKHFNSVSILAQGNPEVFWRQDFSNMVAEGKKFIRLNEELGKNWSKDESKESEACLVHCEIMKYLKTSVVMASLVLIGIPENFDGGIAMLLANVAKEGSNGRILNSINRTKEGLNQVRLLCVKLDNVVGHA